MANTTLSPTDISIRDANGNIKFDLNKQYPVPIYKKSHSASGYVQTYLYLNTLGYYAYGTVGTIDYDYTIKLGTFGTNYSVRPDFVTATISITDASGTRRGTMTGSYIVAPVILPNIVPYNDYVFDSGDVRAYLSIIYHMDLYIDSNNDIILRRRVVKGDTIVTERKTGNPGWNSYKEIIYSPTYTAQTQYFNQFISDDGLFSKYRYNFNYTLDIVAGKFTG